MTSTPASLSSALEPERDIEDELGFVEPARLGSRIVAAMTGIDHDAGHAEAELPRQREAAVRVGRRAAEAPAASCPRQSEVAARRLLPPSRLTLTSGAGAGFSPRAEWSQATGLIR